MKKLYTLTLSDDEVPSSEVLSDFKVISYLLYGELISFEDEYNMNIIVMNNSLRYNELYETKYGNDSYYYRLESEYHKGNELFYNPAKISDTIYGITVYDNVSDDIVNLCLNKVLQLLKKNYKININSYLYKSHNVDDESKRLETIKHVVNDNKKSNIKVKRLIPIMSMFK